MDIKLGQVAKRINSISTSFTYSETLTNCKLKENCSRHDPIFIVEGLSKSRHYNYCSWTISDSKTYYYWITDIVYLSNDLQEVHCKLDPLGTFSSAILGTSQFCIYADSSNWNKEVDDIRWQPEKQGQHEGSGIAPISKTLFSFLTPENGTVILRVMACAGNTEGIKTYAINGTNFGAMLTDLQTVFDNFIPSSTPPSIEEAFMELMELLGKIWGQLAGTGSWADNILSATWVPVPTSHYRNAGGTNYRTMIFVGSVPCTVDCYEVNPIMIEREIQTINIPRSDNMNNSNYRFLRNPRFTAYQITGPSCSCQVDANILKDNEKVYLFSAINLATGDWSAIVTESSTVNTNRLATLGGCMGIDLLQFVGQKTPFGIQSAKVGLDIAGAVMTMGASEGMGMLTGITGAVNASGVSAGCSSSSGTGDVTAYYLGAESGHNYAQVAIVPICFEPVNISQYVNFCNLHGYPANKMITLASGMGFVKCYNASVHPTGATDSDMQFINTCLNNGIYL